MHHIKSLALISQNETMRKVIDKVDKAIPSDTTILLIGETGVGKEILAEYIHRTSPRAQNNIVKISLSAMPEDLLESELFGHEVGSFTSATKEKKGLFEIADNGSIFLDDIDDVPYSIQSKLLRVLESKEIMRIGGTSPIPINVRVISASKVNLKKLVEQNIFRADLFYRLNVVPVEIPPLRERRDDLPLLADHFMSMFSNGKDLKLSNEALRLLINYEWPGNIRELRNVVQRFCLFVEKEIMPHDLPIEIRYADSLDALFKACNRCHTDGSMSFEQIVSCVEHNLLNDALQKTEGNQTEAAKRLGLSLSTFRDKIKKYKLRDKSAGLS